MKKIALISLAIAAVVFVSCGHSTARLQKKPANLIPKDTMVVMISEQLIYEATLDSLKMGSMHVLSKLSGNYYGPWLNKRGYTFEQYEESLIYYFNTSETTQDIMSQVKDYITKKYGGLIPPPTPNPAMPN